MTVWISDSARRKVVALPVDHVVAAVLDQESGAASAQQPGDPLGDFERAELVGRPRHRGPDARHQGITGCRSTLLPIATTASAAAAAAAGRRWRWKRLRQRPKGAGDR